MRGLHARAVTPNCVGGMHAAGREVDLPGGLSSHYYLCESTSRFWFNDLTALRKHLAIVAYNLCGEVEFAQANTTQLCMRPVLVACLKNSFSVDSTYRARLAFDLDADANALVPPVNFIRDTFCEWLGEIFPDVAWADAACVIFAGVFADKPASVHVYFPEYCWEPDEHNRFAFQAVLVDRLTAKFKEFNLKIDKSIHTGGLKYPFFDKWLKTEPPHYRGAAQQMIGTFNCVLVEWDDVFTTCDPLVCSSDAAWNNALSYPPLAQRARVEQQQSSVVYVQPIADIDATLRRLYEAVPAWSGVPVQRKQARLGDGLQVICPQHAYCPIVQRNHSTTGATYVILHANNSFSIKCHKAECVGKSILISDKALEPVERNILERFNERFVLLQGSYVAQLPVRLQDGTYSELVVMQHKQFIDQESRLTEKYDKVSFTRVWLQHEHARRCPLGVVCSPLPRDPRYYNTWRGIRSDVAELATTFVEHTDAQGQRIPGLTEQQLRAKVPNWLRLVEHNICNSEPDIIKYVFDWFAHCFQKPEVKPGVAMVLTGPAGCGKGLTANMIVNIYGAPHAVAINCSNLKGNFNSLYSEVAVLFIDEMEKVKTSKLDNSAFKSLITEPTGVHSEKYVKERVVDMMQHIIMSSNSPDMIKMQNNERRYFVTKCAYNLGEPATAEYLRFCATVAAELKSVDAMAALYTLLMKRELGDYVPTICPFTKAHWHARYFGMCKPQKFVYRVLASGNICQRDLELNNDQKAQFEWLCSEWLFDESVRQGKAVVGIDAKEMGHDVFARKNFRFPKEIWELGYRQQFPDRGDDTAILWREGLLPLATPLEWDFQRTRTVDDKFRTQTCVLLEQATLRQRFVQLCGNVDDRIWLPEWLIE